MFYSQYILTRRGPLSRIWLAAHMQNKLTKTMVFSIDLVKACEKIIAPEAPMALRLTSNLLLGVVRVYLRKAKYLLSDCSDAVSRIKLAFKISTVICSPRKQHLYWLLHFAAFFTES
uniref:Rad21/Rec8-like protein N-terminal domain-containing protein n=1 Tax=Rhodosorus marinus TaxID=101924 RepID=A0A7S3EBL5_9RHOD|mmetsp:Transcript_23043/g.92243  ORF Transcript_23043/g.92243 Transcript_23043/m.92243 type:complete len:117 (+) Transcript_23043:217-567(+)